MIKRHHVEYDFFEQGEAMRAELDRRFSKRYGGEGVQWEYFCDPGLYTYLRAKSDEVFPPELFGRFMARLRQWALDALGVVPTGRPMLHVMVNGCKLDLHSDFHNGVWGYVYSLTRWTARTFRGGETLLLRDGIPSYRKHHVHGESLYELIPPTFNQLLVFDDRIVHGTPVIEGSMDPKEGRIALVGHMRAAAPTVIGALTPEAVDAAISTVLPDLAAQLKSHKDVQGTITCRLRVSTSGRVEAIETLTDNLVVPAVGHGPSDAVENVKMLIERGLRGLQFPAAEGESTITLAVLVPIPDLRRIEVAVASGAAAASIARQAAAQRNGWCGMQGEWRDDAFVVREPVAGSVRFDGNALRASFAPPMWVPAQREQFAVQLRAALEAAVTTPA